MRKTKLKKKQSWSSTFHCLTMQCMMLTVSKRCQSLIHARSKADQTEWKVVNVQMGLFSTMIVTMKKQTKEIAQVKSYFMLPN